MALSGLLARRSQKAAALAGAAGRCFRKSASTCNTAKIAPVLMKAAFSKSRPLVLNGSRKMPFVFFFRDGGLDGARGGRS
eukprot:15006415-Alexandrium_andersonii.AAC.1